MLFSPYPVSSSLSYLFISVISCARLFGPAFVGASCLASAFELVLLTVVASIGSLDVSPSTLDCPLGCGLLAYLTLSVFSCARLVSRQRRKERNYQR